MSKIPKLEQAIFAAAITLSAGHLALIAFAAYKLGITVPTCVLPDAALFKPAVIKKGDKRYEVHVSAKMWDFEPNFLRVPAGATVDMFVSSKDVLHGFNILGTNVNMMAIPGTIANAQVHFSKPGRYPIVCHEYCGAGHQNMGGLIVVDGTIDDIETSSYPAALLANESSTHPDIASGDGASPEVAAKPNPGFDLAQSKGCLGCHSTDGKPMVGPSFKELYGKSETMADGSTVTVNDDYLKESMLEPGKKVVNGFSALMPVLPLTPEEIATLISFIKSHSKKGQ